MKQIVTTDAQDAEINRMLAVWVEIETWIAQWAPGHQMVVPSSSGEVMPDDPHQSVCFLAAGNVDETDTDAIRMIGDVYWEAQELWVEARIIDRHQFAKRVAPDGSIQVLRDIRDAVDAAVDHTCLDK